MDELFSMYTDGLFNFGTHCRLVSLGARLMCLYFGTPCTRNVQVVMSTRVRSFSDSKLEVAYGRLL